MKNDIHENEKAMSLFEHLDELRSRVFKSLAACLAIFFGSLAYAEQILNFLKTPLLDALPDKAANLHFTGPMDVFVVSIKTSMLVAFIASAPIWLYQFWKFIEPALHKHEKKYVFPMPMNYTYTHR